MKTSFFVTFVLAAVVSASAIAESDNAARGLVSTVLPACCIGIDLG